MAAAEMARYVATGAALGDTEESSARQAKRRYVSADEFTEVRVRRAHRCATVDAPSLLLLF